MDITEWYGEAEIDPDRPVVGGTQDTWKIIYRVGKYGVDCCGAVALRTHSSSDWELPQLEDPRESAYASVTHNGDANVTLLASFDFAGGVRPLSRELLIRVTGGSLAEGDEVVVTLGDQAGGSPGCRAQTFKGDVDLEVLVDPFATGRFQAVNSPIVKIIAGPATSMSVTVPSHVAVGEQTSAIVRVSDMWGNRTPYVGRVSVAGFDTPELVHHFVPEDDGVHRFDVRISEEGVHRLRAETEDRLSAESNPIKCEPVQPTSVLLWGDTQSQSGETVGTGTLDEFFKYADDVAGLDFVAHSANDFQITRDLWKEIEDANVRYNVPGRFVTFLGYEWSGNTPSGGDHSVMFLNDAATLHRSSHALIDELSDIETDRYPVDKLFDELISRGDGIAIPHIGGRRANLNFVHEEVVPAIEIVSCHGHFEWFAQEAVRRRLKVGFVGATDDHSGRPGASFPCNSDLQVKGGLTGVYAAGRDRESVWYAIRHRHCYATTGARLILSVNAGDAVMGDETTSPDPCRIEVRCIGTAPLETIEIMKDEHVVHVHRVAPVGSKVRVAWGGARSDTRGRVTDWSGSVSLSGGRVLSATKWAFDSPLHDVWIENRRTVAWKSSTVGDWDGVVLDIDAPEAATLALAAGPADLEIALSSLDPAGNPLRWDMGGVDQRVMVGFAPKENGPLATSFTWEDPNPTPGTSFYWVRVTQVDGEMAWSSPIIYGWALSQQTR